MKKSIFNLALQISRKKISSHPEYDFFLHYTFLIQDDKILGFGMNHQGSPPIHYGYGRQGNATYAPKTHSEISAWKKVRGILDKKKDFIVLNIRLNKRGETRTSKPCPACLGILGSLRCAKIYYSTDEDFLML